MARGRKKQQPAANGEFKPLDGAATGPQLHNVTDETIREWGGKLVRAKAEADKARKEASSKAGFHRQLYKDAGKAGCSAQALAWYISNKDRDPAEIDRETLERNRVAKAMSLPIGTQLGMLDTGQTVAGAVDQAKIREAETGSDLSAYDQGKQAALNGKGILTNPFETESDDWNAFEQGWGQGMRKGVSALGGDGSGASAH